MNILKKRLNQAVLIIIIGIFISILPFIVIAAIDAPHNESNDIDCNSCHGKGLLQSFWGGSGIYSTIDELCLSCHWETSCPGEDYPPTSGPQVKPHKDSNGTVIAECCDCHNPHYQLQKSYKNTDTSRLYLASGTITDCIYNPPVEPETIGTSIFSYSSITYKDGWDAEKIKGKTNPCRHAILFPNIEKLGFSYDIKEINESSSEIVVYGNACESPYSNFMVIYGQYIKNTINGKKVKFFDRKGTNSYSDGDATNDGVCEVCHTQTLYHKNDGTGNYHYPAARCYVCHNHVNGLTYDHGEPGKDCEDCHGHDDGWNGGSYYGTTQSHSTHTENDSDDLKGPNITCSDCHDTNDYPFFKSGTDGDGDGKYNLSETDVCDNCHSPNGTFDGVNDVVIGAKNNWESGVYASSTLKTGKEKWCAGCHDDQPAYSKSEIITPIIMDDPDATYVCSWGWRNQEWGYYGSGYRYYAAGDGSCTATWIPTIPKAGYYKVYAWWQAGANRASNAPYTINYDGSSETVRVDQRYDSDQWNYLGMWLFAEGTSGSITVSDDTDNTVIADAIKLDGPGTYAPNVIGDNVTYGFYVTGHKINCLYCHDAEKRHIDHEHRTYEADETTKEAINPYCDGYRLKDVDGQPCMIIPRPTRGVNTNPLDTWQDFALCFKCHDKYKVLSTTSPPDTTNFWNNDASPTNSHYIHLRISTYHADTDWDSGHGAYGGERNDSSETCISCHNVHGSSSKAMIRHGEFISSYGTTDKSPSLNFSYLVPYTPPYATATWIPNLGGGTYDVYAWWEEGSNRATNAKYTVFYNGGLDEITVNQQTNGSQWNLLGRYDFSAGTSGYVVLSNEGADGYVMADAVGWDSDLDGTPDVIVDNGDSGFSYTGDCLGNWTCATGITDAYDNDHCYHVKPGPQVDTNATVEQSVGGILNFAGGQTPKNGVCRACHSGYSYLRTPTYVGPRVLMQKVEPSSVDNNGTDTVLFTAYVYSPDDTISTVTIDLIPIDGSATQTMYDDGTHGDAVAGDKIYSYQTTVPGTVDTGLKKLTVTGTDSLSRTGTGDIELMIANPGWTVVDNWDADFVGYWSSSTSGDLYGTNIKYHASGSGSDTATFTPILSQSGNYKVYAWWTSHSNRATNATYTINHSSGSDIVSVDQRDNGGQFVYLGTYHFNTQSGYTSVVVDNVDAVFTGTWSTSVSGDEYYGTDLRYIQSTATGSNTATYTPDLPQAGNYDVYAWWTSHSNRAKDVPYIITYSDGAGGTLVDTVRVDQEQGEGGWTYLGTYYFEAGTSGNVEISDDAELDEYIIADAIKWQLSSTQQCVVLSDDADGYVMADAILFEPE